MSQFIPPNYNLLLYEIGTLPYDTSKSAYIQLKNVYRKIIRKNETNFKVLFSWFESLTSTQLENIGITKYTDRKPYGCDESGLVCDYMLMKSVTAINKYRILSSDDIVKVITRVLPHQDRQFTEYKSNDCFRGYYERYFTNEDGSQRQVIIRV